MYVSTEEHGSKFFDCGDTGKEFLFHGSWIPQVFVQFPTEMSGGSVEPMSAPVSTYRYLSLLQSSLGKEMAPAEVTFMYCYPRWN
jgi:hypothetical protein